MPGQDTYPGRGFDPWLGHIPEGKKLMFLFHIDVSLSLPSFFPFLSL